MSATKRCPCRDICVARYQVKGPIAGHRLQVLCASECVRGAGSGLLLAEGAANTGTPGYDLHDVVDKCGSHRNGANSFPHDAGAICRVAEALWRRIDAPCVIFSTHFRVLLLQCAVEQELALYWRFNGGNWHVAFDRPHTHTHTNSTTSVLFTPHSLVSLCSYFHRN
jgi:hypothetical protein